MTVVVPPTPAPFTVAGCPSLSLRRISLRGDSICYGWRKGNGLAVYCTLISPHILCCCQNRSAPLLMLGGFTRPNWQVGCGAGGSRTHVQTGLQYKSKRNQLVVKSGFEPEIELLPLRLNRTVNPCRIELRSLYIEAIQCVFTN